jgi:macrocin-O-methyltransferase TylF-like protien
VKTAQPSDFGPRRYDETLLRDHLKYVIQRHSGNRVFLLTDMELPDLGIPAFDCRRNRFFQDFPVEDISGSVFYCIFDSDDLASQIISTIATSKGIFYPAPVVCPPASYFHFHDVARNILRNELEDQMREGFAKWDCGAGDMINLIQCIDVTRELPGCFVEIGTYRGSSGRLALRYMRAIGIIRICYFFDTFTGFDYQEAENSPDRLWAGTHSTEGMTVIEKRLAVFSNEQRGLITKVMKANIIRDPLPQDLKEIALANIDVDLYEAVDAALMKIAPLIVKNGIVIVEDAGHTPALIGARIALNRFLATPQGNDFLPIYMESGQTLLIRK